MAATIRALRYPIEDDANASALRLEGDYEAYVNQLIRQVLLTNPGERINRPDFGGGVRRLVFSPISSTTASLAQTMIYSALNETLADIIRVDEIQVQSVDSRLDVVVVYTLYARMTQVRLNLEVVL